jgi:hypothetical protein
MTSAQGLWSAYRDSAFVNKSEHYAKYTIPSLMVDVLEKGGGEQNSSITHDFQSVGSLLLNNLAAKLTALLFPSNQPFFKIVASDALKAIANKKGIAQDTLATKLSLVEQKATENLFANAAFAKLTRVIKLILVTGQALIYRDPKTQKFRIWSLQNFVVKRNAAGDWICIVLRQEMRFYDLPKELQVALRSEYRGKYKADSKVTLYTKIERKQAKLNDIVTVTEEVDGKTVGEVAQYPIYLSPWILPVWDLADGENYARGMVEEYAGDFAKLSILSEQLGLYELDSLQVLNLVNESKGSTIDDFAEANSGDYIPGDKDSIASHETGDYQKMNSIRQSLSEVIARLSVAFMYTGNTRDAERVTAEEIRAQAREAENMLGGAYSVLAETFQTPVAYLTMQEVSDEIMLGLINRSFYPKIITGIPALNRSVESQNFLSALNELTAVIPVLAQTDPRLSPQKIADMIYRNKSVDTTAVFKDEAELRKEAADQNALANQAAQQGAGALPLSTIL